MSDKKEEMQIKEKIEKDLDRYPKHFFAYRNKAIRRTQSEKLRKEMDTLKVPPTPPPTPKGK